MPLFPLRPANNFLWRLLSSHDPLHRCDVVAYQEALKQLARDFAKNEMIPVAGHYDQTMEYPTPIFEKAWELGLINTHVPESCGGLELGCLEGVLIGEEVCVHALLSVRVRIRASASALSNAWPVLLTRLVSSCASWLGFWPCLFPHLLRAPCSSRTAAPVS